MRYLFLVFSHSLPANFYCVVLKFFFGERLMYMCKNFKLLCCAAYVLIVSIINVSVLLAEFVVFGRIFSRIL